MKDKQMHNTTKKTDSVYLLAAAVGTMLTLAFPVLSLVTNFFCMILMGNNKYRKYFALLLAFSLAIVAYIWVPDQSMDLYRHHHDVSRLAGFNFELLGSFVGKNMEPFQYILKFIVGQTGDYGLLQFIVIFCGYFELFWTICDIAKIKSVKRFVFMLIFIYAASVIRFIDFASGLWFNFAVINIALGVYLLYYRKTKLLPYAFFAIAVCSHIGTLYAVVLILIINRLRLFKKIHLSVMITMFLIMLSFGWIVLLINNLMGGNSTFVDILNRMYDGYFVNGAQFEELHTGWSLFLSLANLILCLSFGVWHYRKVGDKKDYDSLIVYLTVSVIATIVGAGVFIRFRSLLVILALPLIVSFFETSRDKVMRLFVATVLISLSSIQVYRIYVQAQSVDLTNRVNSNITRSVFNLPKGG